MVCFSQWWSRMNHVCFKSLIGESFYSWKHFLTSPLTKALLWWRTAVSVHGCVLTCIHNVCVLYSIYCTCRGVGSYLPLLLEHFQISSQFSLFFPHFIPWFKDVQCFVSICHLCLVDSTELHLVKQVNNLLYCRWKEYLNFPLTENGYSWGLWGVWKNTGSCLRPQSNHQI